jgi:dextranase
LFDNELHDVSMTHADGDNLEYEPLNYPYSTYGEPGKVWTIIREKPGYKTVSLINLTGNTDDLWNYGKKEPLQVENIMIRVQLAEPVKNVFLASPDIDMGRPKLIDYHIESGKRGKTLVVCVSMLHFWSLLVIELKS